MLLNAGELIEIGPGEPAQFLHRVGLDLDLFLETASRWFSRLVHALALRVEGPAVIEAGHPRRVPAALVDNLGAAMGAAVEQHVNAAVAVAGHQIDESIVVDDFGRQHDAGRTEAHHSTCLIRSCHGEGPRTRLDLVLHKFRRHCRFRMGREQESRTPAVVAHASGVVQQRGLSDHR